MADGDTNKAELGAISEAAHSWRARLDNELANDEDRAAFQHWLLEDPRHQEEYARIEALWGRLGAITEGELAPQNHASLDHARAMSVQETGPKPEQPPEGRRWRHSAWFPRTVSAVAAGAIAATVAFLVVPLPDFLNPTPEIVAPSVTAYATARGEVTEIVLPDGSVATLGANSAIEFAISPTVRDVTLTRGEAFFAVAEEPSRPFTVKADALLVEVTGTAFGVRLGEMRTDVAVSEGDVRVSYPMVIGGEPNPTMRSQRQVSAGSAITATRERGLRSPTSIREDAVAAWRKGRLVYVATPLSEVIADANRYSVTEIVIADEAVGDITVSGSFDADKIGETLDILSEILPVRIDRSQPDMVRVIAAED